MNWQEKRRMMRDFDRDEDYGERGGNYSGGNYGGRGGYGERDEYDHIEKAICKGIEHGIKKAMKEMEDDDDDSEYGERRGVRGTGPYSRVRRRY